MIAKNEESLSSSARRWRRWLWEAAETGEPAPGCPFDTLVFEDSELAGLMGEDAYAELVTELAERPDLRRSQLLARNALDAIFPFNCRCRGKSAMEHDYLRFDAPAVYRSLYFSDTSVTQTMRRIFRRTPGVNILECQECGDIWMQAHDQVIWIQHLALLEASHIKHIEAHCIWPTVFDRFEDDWSAAYGILGRHSRGLQEWQALHNPPAAFARFGKRKG
ncbi:MAG: hypothetical protein FJX29_14800 [Alphaproteobacteria bacterium]|nr:hypothetical protein [Alphaproteobacteria bacterium]